MKIAGIVCEYNPFHNGHKYHIEKTRENGATHIVCAMSGNFVQRGECAIADKWSRAKVAVLSGADLVVEIPTAWACSSAENFAGAAVKLLSSLHIDMLSFGCETDSLELLKNAAKAVDSPLVGEKIKTFRCAGATYPAALQKAVAQAFDEETASVLAMPNNTLAVEYIRQKEKNDADFELLAIKRVGSFHNDTAPANDFFSSASAIRKVEKVKGIMPYIPLEMYKELEALEKNGLYPCCTKNADRVIIATLRAMTLSEIQAFVSDESGLAQRIFLKSRSSENVAQLIKSVKVKSYTEAAVRRAVMLCFLRVTKELSKSEPPYIKILAANKKGFEILKKRQSSLPVITQKSQADRLLPFAKSVYDLECECTDRFSLFSKKIPDCSREQTSPIFVL